MSPQRLVLGSLEIEHIVPSSRGGTDDEDNLWLACRPCNNFKSARTSAIDPITGLEVSIFNPRLQTWAEHFRWSEDGTRIIGTSAQGRATVLALQLNNAIAVAVRRNWVSAGWYPPHEQ